MINEELKTPPLKVLALNIKTAKISNNNNEIVAISAIQISDYNLDTPAKDYKYSGFTVLRPFEGHKIPANFNGHNVV